MVRNREGRKQIISADNVSREKGERERQRGKKREVETAPRRFLEQCHAEIGNVILFLFSATISMAGQRWISLFSATTSYTNAQTQRATVPMSSAQELDSSTCCSTHLSLSESEMRRCVNGARVAR